MRADSLDDLAHLEVPDDDLGVLARTRDKPIAFADVYIGNIIEVAVEAGLQSQRVSIPHFQNSIAAQRTGLERTGIGAWP